MLDASASGSTAVPEGRSSKWRMKLQRCRVGEAEVLGRAVGKDAVLPPPPLQPLPRCHAHFLMLLTKSAAWGSFMRSRKSLNVNPPWSARAAAWD